MRDWLLKSGSGVALFLASYFGISGIANLLNGANAVDSSSYVSVEQAKAFVDSGAITILQPLTVWSPCGQPAHALAGLKGSLENVQTAGAVPGGYILLDPYTSGRDAVDRAKDSISAALWDSLDPVALDYEIPDGCPGVPYQTIADACTYLGQLGKQVVISGQVHTCLIYTNYGNWVGNLGNPQAPDGSALWNAYWDDSADVDFEHLPFGDWTIDDVWGEQFQGSTDVNGVYVDLDFIRPEVGPVITPPECSCFEPDWRFDACDPAWGGVHIGPAHMWVKGGTDYFDDDLGVWTTAPACPTQ